MIVIHTDNIFVALTLFAIGILLLVSPGNRFLMKTLRMDYNIRRPIRRKFGKRISSLALRLYGISCVLLSISLFFRLSEEIMAADVVLAMTMPALITFFYMFFRSHKKY